MDKEKVLALLRKECERAGSQAAWAQKHGMSPVYVSDTLAGRRAPAGKILSALGMEQVTTYRKIRREGNRE